MARHASTHAWNTAWTALHNTDPQTHNAAQLLLTGITTCFHEHEAPGNNSENKAFLLRMKVTTGDPQMTLRAQNGTYHIEGLMIPDIGPTQPCS